MDQPSTEPPGSGAPSREPLLDRTVTHVSRLRALALVPLATALLNVGDLLAVGATNGISIQASFPVYRYDLWSFINPPRGDGLSASVPFGTLDSPALIVPLLVVYVIVSGALSAGYFGSIADGITTGQFDFVAGVRRFAVRMITLEALIIVVLAVGFLPILVVPPLLVLAVIGLLVVGYLFFPTAYLIALEDRGVESAARRAYGLVTRQQPLWFFLAVAAATALCSAPLSLLARMNPFFGVLAAIAAAPLGLAFNVATALKVAKMAGVETIE